MSRKFHINIRGNPACGRQLSNHRDTRFQGQDTMRSKAFVEFQELPEEKKCRHCLRAVGLQRASREAEEAFGEAEEFEDAFEA